MKAIAIVPGAPGVRLVDRPEPTVTAPDEIKLRVLQVGVCGTDREEAAGGRANAPDHSRELVIGHEMLGQVVETGAAVDRVKPGDYAVITVRRGCGKCTPCAMNRPDMCRTGDYRERGIRGLDGYQTEYVVDRQEWVVRVPPELAAVGVLAEPASVLEKAIQEAVRIQFARLPDALATPQWLYGRRCLVAGLGPIGLLAAAILRLRGACVWGLDIVEPGTARPRWLEQIGGRYVDGRELPPEKIDKAMGRMDLIVEATGVPRLGFNLIDALAPNGILALTGIPSGPRCMELPGAELVRAAVLRNAVVFGSVNAARDHFQAAVDDLGRAVATWGDHVEKLITHHYAWSEFESAVSRQGVEEIKAVVDWDVQRTR
jgi:threonine dehydrogenase-like Zn-dependent dehydrogenase